MIWVGTYAAKGGQGLYPLSLDRDGLHPGSPDPRIANASFGIWDASGRTAFLVDEHNEGRLNAWRRHSEQWRHCGSTETGGALPCYLALHPRLPLLAVANYGSGSVALIAFDPSTGRPGPLRDTCRQSGHGPNSERQEAPHAHCALFDERGERLFHVDLGLDLIVAYPVTDDRLGDGVTWFEAPAGSGPRHLKLSGDGRYALLLCELSAELLLLEREADGFVLRDRVETAPGASDNLGGHLELLGDEIWVSNRGEDTLARFRLRGGRLERDGRWRTGGRSPRHFVPHRDGMLVANEESGTVTFVRLAQGVAPEPVGAPVPGTAFLFELPD